MLSLIFKFLVGHALADFALQSEWMARNKNRHRQHKIPWGSDQFPETVWPVVLTAHAVIHGGMVLFITGSVGLGIAETVAHWCIDFGKCENWYGMWVDQGLHLICKAVWLWYLYS